MLTKCSSWIRAMRSVPKSSPDTSPCKFIQRWFGQPVAQTHPHLLREGDVTPGILQQEYRIRRLRLMELIAREKAVTGASCSSIVIFPSSPQVFMTNDIPYPFRQNTDFLYLTGFLEPNSILVLHMEGESPLGARHTSTLFMQKKDPLRDLWDGPRSGADGAVFLTGIDQAFDIDQFDGYMSKYMNSCVTTDIWYEHRRPVHSEYHATRVARLLHDNKNKKLESPRRLVQLLRLVKSEAEIELMRRSCEVASQAFIDVMKFSKPDINESHLYAKMDYECRLRGAEYLAYPPVVAGGDRANIIHYVSNNQLIRADELVLMDAGCEYHGYSSDITRTWPVCGTFSTCQRELYEALLGVQLACVTMCRADAGLTMDRLYVEMLVMIGKQLQRLGVIQRGVGHAELLQMARQFCPHHIGHYLGMDVHDTDEMPRSISLSPGMIVTVEPGIYIPRATSMDVPVNMRGIGMRIEDDVLITTGEPETLSRHCPKDPDELQRIVLNK